MPSKMIDSSPKPISLYALTRNLFRLALTWATLGRSGGARDTIDHSAGDIDATGAGPTLVAEGLAPDSTAPWLRVSHEPESSVQSASTLCTRYVTGMMMPSDMNQSGCTRSSSGSCRVSSQ